MSVLIRSAASALAMSNAPELLPAAGMTAFISAMTATMLAIINMADVMAFSMIYLRIKCLGV